MPLGIDRERCQYRLVGRGSELTQLERIIADTRSGAADAVLVQGPAGIGKSRLMGAALQSVPSDTLVLRASGEDRTTGLPWGAVRELFAPLGLSSADAASSPLLQDGARWAVPALGSHEGGSERRAGADTYAVLHGLYWLTVNLSARQPLVIAIDDVHLCDESSLHWLDFLLRRAEGLALCVVLSERTGGCITAPVLAEFAARGRGRRIELGPLDQVGVADLAAEILHDEASAELVDACAEVSGGIPLLLERLLGELGQGTLAPHGTLADHVRHLGRDVIAASVANRVLGQPEHVGKVAKALAVVGEQDIDLLAALSGVPLPLVGKALEVLQRNDILGEQDRVFRHDLIRTTVLSEMSNDERDGLRSRAARLLRDLGSPSESVAELLLQLPWVSEAWMLDVFSDAAAEAGRRGAPRATARYLTAILAVTPLDPKVVVQLAGVLAQFDPASAITHLDRALDLVTEPRQRAVLAVEFGMMAVAVHRTSEAVGLLCAALTDLSDVEGEDPSAADQELRTLVEAALILTGFQQKHTVAFTRERIQAMAIPAGETMAERQKLAMMAVSMALHGVGVGEVVEKANRALLLDDAGLGGWTVFASLVVLRLADELGSAAAAVEKLVLRSQEQASAWTYHLAVSARVSVHLAGGEVDAAAADAQTAVDLARLESWEKLTTLPKVALARVLAIQGKLSEAQALLAEVGRPRLEDSALEYPTYLEVQALVRAQLGDHVGAVALLRGCARSLQEAQLSNPVFVPWWVDVAVLLTDAGQAHDAEEAVQHGEDLVGRWGTARARGLGLFARGVITPGAGGIQWLEEAVRVLRDSPARLELARVEYRLGEAFLHLDDRPAARRHLREAVNVATCSGARFLATRARDLLVAAGGRMRDLPECRSDALTGSERRVVEFALRGASNREIAQALFVTPRTVEVHLTSSYRKLGIIGRPELAFGMAAPRQRLR